MSRKKKYPELCKNTLWEERFDNKILKSILKMFNIEVIFRATLAHLLIYGKGQPDTRIREIK